jgi:hypothetical protein
MKFWKQCLCILMLYPVVMFTACTAAQVDMVLSDVDLVLQTANSLGAAIGAISPADAAALSLLTGVAITGVNAIKTAYDAYEASKTASNLQNVIVAAQTLQKNLPQELAVLHIQSQNAVTKATAWVNLVVSTAEAVVTTVSAVTGAPTTAKTHGFIVSVTPESLQARWQQEVCSGDTACGTLVRIHHKKTARHLKL